MGQRGTLRSEGQSESTGRQISVQAKEELSHNQPA